jgi:hypothetical protein
MQNIVYGRPSQNGNPHIMGIYVSRYGYRIQVLTWAHNRWEHGIQTTTGVRVSASVLLGMDRFLNEADFRHLLGVFRFDSRIFSSCKRKVGLKRRSLSLSLSLCIYIYFSILERSHFPRVGSSSCQLLAIDRDTYNWCGWLRDDYGMTTGWLRDDYGMTMGW